MEKIRNIVTRLLFLIMILGLALVICTMGCYVLKIKGFSNNYVDWFVQNASVDFSWKKDFTGEYGKYDVKKTPVERYVGVVEGITDTIEEFCTGAFPENAKIKETASLYKSKVLRNSISVEAGKKTNEEYAVEAVGYIRAFDEYLAEKDIDFLYVLVPAGTRIHTCAYEEEYPTALLAWPDCFAETLENTDVKFLNMNLRTDLIKGFQVDDSGHWFPKDALVTTKEIAKAMNQKFDFKYLLEEFEEDAFYNILENHSDITNGLKKRYGYDFEMYVPYHSPTYEMNFNDQEEKKGSFDDVFLTSYAYWQSETSASHATPYHNMLLINNRTYGEIINTDCLLNQDRKVLILGDSFSWPITMYLSMEVKNIAFLNPRYFEGNVKVYIDYFQPDTILWIYQEGQLPYENNINFGWVQD